MSKITEVVNKQIEERTLDEVQIYCFTELSVSDIIRHWQPK